MNGWTVFEAPAAAVLREEDGAATSVLICVNWERSRLPLLLSLSLSALRIERRRIEGREIPSPFLKVERKKKRDETLCSNFSRRPILDPQLSLSSFSGLLLFEFPPPGKGTEEEEEEGFGVGWGKRAPNFRLRRRRRRFKQGEKRRAGWEEGSEEAI